MDVREKLVELLSKYFDIGDSYCYNLTRTKDAFACGTMGFDDFEEFDDETVADIAENLIAHGVTVQEQDGCEYCKADNDGFRRMFGAFSLVNPFHGKGWQIHAGKCKPREINFCPMCVRRLPQLRCKNGW